MSLPIEGLQRRHFIDLVHRRYYKWINPDPTVEIKVGTYGVINKETGLFMAQGNIYDPEFQEELDKHGAGIRMSDYPPEMGPMESDVVIATRDVKERELRPGEVNVPGLANAPIKSEWTFTKDKTDAVFIMHEPHQIYLPPRVALEPLYKVDKLYYKSLISVVHVTDAYTYYLSDKSGGKLSLALVPDKSDSGKSKGFKWWADASGGLLRQASDPEGKCTFMSVYRVLKPIKRIRRTFIDKIRPEPSGDELWLDDSSPWDPIDEDGLEDELDPEVTAVDPFAIVEQLHMQKCDGCATCNVIRQGPPKD